MKKELNYLSLPDHFNKFVLTNFNQKINLKKNILLQFKLDNNNHLGSALKAIYLLEVIFPKKSFVLKLVLKKKKLYFGQKIKSSSIFSFNLNLYSIDFIDFFRFFSLKPFFFKKTNLDELLVINKKLKQFEFNNNLLLLSKNLDNSFIFLQLYHLN